MRLTHATWYEVEAYLEKSPGIILPVGSIEQHGPMGIIGTDALCAEDIAQAAGRGAGAYVAPVVGYTPAEFNMAFPGTMSLSVETFTSVISDLLHGLHGQGFTRIYILNAHGANLAPMRDVASTLPEGATRIKSWWDFDAVNRIRQRHYGDWEGLHATPSEVAITQALHRVIEPGPASEPPRKLPPEEIAARAGDRHEPAAEHRALFPDGRVGSHSALARPGHGFDLLAAAANAVAEDYRNFIAA